ncbi:LysM peptidoglycan-binding domain-containing protein [Psychromonas sp. KJ10-10]|uniref:LysM peptidoglycan-binding domain-containing protein n=1 Tax=Psychromonas sp. KJ10-10 TaxID=3391823 RepID=UPI0039B4A97D
MPYRFYPLILCLLGLFACSSSGGRAPVSNVGNNISEKMRKTKNTLHQDTYTVKTGDTLYGIAWRAGVHVNELIKLNQIKNLILLKKVKL